MQASPFSPCSAMSAAAAAIAIICAPASAQEVKALRGKPSSDMILEALTPAPVAATAVPAVPAASMPAEEAVPARRRRGLSLASDEPVAMPAAAPAVSVSPTPAPVAAAPAPMSPAQAAAPAAAAPAIVPVAAVAAPQMRALDLEIQFKFGSDELTNDGKDVLDQLASALKSERLANARSVILEGHADARGNPAFNQALSLKRAQSARNYLASRHGIAMQKLSAIGKGSSDPADKSNPESEINRRVRVILEI